jgi:hypothetical protein
LSATKKRGFIALTPGVNIINFFSSSLTLLGKKLEHLSLEVFKVSSWTNLSYRTKPGPSFQLQKVLCVCHAVILL